MIQFTQEKYHTLCESYLAHVEQKESNPAAFIVGRMRRYAHVTDDVELYVTLMLLDGDDRPLLGEFLVRDHYAETGRNILIETGKGLVGEDAETLAREYIAEIVSRSDRFQDAIAKIQSKEKKNANRKISKHLQEAARWRKENRILGNDIRLLLDQVAKKRRQIERNEARIQELMTSVEEIKGAASAPPSAEEPENDPLDKEWFEDNFCMCL